MSLTPTETEEHFFKAMVDAADGSTPEELEPTERREHWYQEIIDAIKAGGGGSGGGVLVVHDDNGQLDKTWQEIYNEYFVVIVHFIGETEKHYYYVRSVDVYDGVYEVATMDDQLYTTDNASGYPTISE